MAEGNSELSEDQLNDALWVMASSGRNTGKACPACDAEYLHGKVTRTPKVGLEITHCVDCGAAEVWAVLPLCWCGSIIRPRDRFCSREGHMICRYGCAPCPGWHDYSERFVDK